MTVRFAFRIVLSAITAMLISWIVFKLGLGYLFVGSVFLAASIFHLSLRPRPVELAVTAGVAIAVGVLRSMLGSPGEFTSNVPSAICIFAGAASLIVLGCSTVWTEGAEHARRMTAFAPAIAMLAFILATIPFLSGQANSAASSPTFDSILAAVDGSLGFQPSFAMGRILARHYYLLRILGFFYDTLPIDIAIVYAAKMFRSESTLRTNLLVAVGAVGVAGFCLYRIIPACGPIYAFPIPVFPWHEPSVSYLRSDLPDSFPRNAMPSLHFAWALIVLWAAKPCGRLTRAVAFLFVVTTFFATIGTGEHYFVDLVVAVPFAVFIDELLQRGRWAVAIPCAALVALWFVALRLFPQNLAALGYANWIFVALSFSVISLRKPASVRGQRDGVR